MLQIRQSEDRGQANHGWLASQHSFSFGHYHDPLHVGFGALLVINEDRVAPAQGFGSHGHRDMEILSYVLDGALEHKDSMGSGSVLHYGDVQRMSAGKGVRHSEFNHSHSEGLHFLQIWIAPNVSGIEPSYQEKHFDPASKAGQLRLVASGDGRDGSVLIHQDASLYASIPAPGQRLQHRLAAGRNAYVHLIRGALLVNGAALKGGDALKISDTELVVLEQADDAEVLLFDLPPV
ncbi:quercetin 2,3-dioxygenase [Janthinobacterium sp. CG_23.3]|uniref:pirin family protein n=1 Tax=unclassified Janthinobacterium TaxID=2610881 RepID=UPI00037B5326|nr:MULTISPECIES: pirin family protein [unclassified Janthinobacterium]MEC5159298.1 redox-sensitive bicupin YhaK (pirin superfamily) [Janthinobacterium sp. CG_S6]